MAGWLWKRLKSYVLGGALGLALLSGIYALLWTTGAWWADWGLCLARTNWDVPKHRGLTVFMLEMRQPGIGYLGVVEV